MGKKPRLASQMFTAIAAVLAAALCVHAVVFNLAFPYLYAAVQSRQMKREFQQVCAQVEFTGRTGINTALLDYAKKNETAVLVFDSDGEIWDGNLFFFLSILSVSTEDGQVFRIPLKYIKDIPDGVSGVHITAKRLGTSNYFDPRSIIINGTCCFNKSGSEALTGEDITYSTRLKKLRFTPVEGSKTSDRAWLLYENTRNCLTSHTVDVARELNRLDELGTLRDGSQDCRFLTLSRQAGDKTVYFVTLVPAGMTGVEEVFIGNYFVALYALLALMLLAASFWLARRLSRPMVELGEQVKRIARMDFSAKVSPQHGYELGLLADHINSMSHSLENAMQELKLAAERAEKNEDRIRQLMANLAHEFKTPLGIISLYSEVIETENFEKDRGYYFSIINEEIESLTRMVDEAIQLCKLQSGQMKISPRRMDLQELAEAALAPFEAAIHQGNYQVCVDLPEVDVLADGVRIKQVLVNLLSNALKYSSPAGEIRVTARVEAQTVWVSVENSGHVSEGNLERIWSRYYRDSNAAVTRMPGDGIGLDIVREILILSRSEFGVEQTEGKIRFYFTLPLWESEAGEAP